MNRNLKDCLNGNYENCVTPFFWQHGDGHAALLHMIEVIKGAGMDSFCVESRVHKEFCEEKWWDDFGFILREAEKRSMKVWLLDDKHFPSGYANDWLKSHPQLVRKLLREEHMDVAGPMRQISVLCNRCAKGERILYALAYRRTPENELLGECIDLTEKINNGLILWDVPEGFWRILLIIETNGVAVAKTRRGDDSAYYIDMLSAESCRAMIDAVYEPHFKHFSKYFGKTFLGFFSDEPCFSNEKWTYCSKLGKKDVPLPWCEELLPMIAETTGLSTEKVKSLLASLWFETAENTAEMRYGYMDAVSKLYKRNFSDMLGDWCREHSVSYIGHIIEDMNAHQRLGYGCGHFFRALSGQDMSGIDVVLHQIVPGFTEITHTALISDGGIADPEFFDYTMAKLGASAAHIDAKKKNRCMCEVFGAYGWAEGLPISKYLIDHMLVNGVNYFVPHAFTPHYPNKDCPPHFYAGGTNPQFKYFGELVAYTNRCVKMLADSVHIPDVALLYNAEGEWCAGEYELCQGIAKRLTQNQIDFDIIPSDALMDASVENGRLRINSESYSAIIVAYCELLPAAIIKNLSILAGKGLPVVFTGGLPTAIAGNALPAGFEVIDSNQVALWVKNKGFAHIQFEEKYPHLRFYNVKNAADNIIMFFNDSLFETVQTAFSAPFEGGCRYYDAWSGELYCPEVINGKYLLRLPPQSTLFAVFSKETNIQTEGSRFVTEIYEPQIEFDIYITNQSSGKQRRYAQKSGLINLSAPEHLPRFCGFIRYVGELDISALGDRLLLDLGTVGETAEVIINGTHCGLRIQSPYAFDITKAAKLGKNSIEILVANNPAYRERDFFSSKLALPPSGILGAITLKVQKEVKNDH